MEIRKTFKCWCFVDLPGYLFKMNFFVSCAFCLIMFGGTRNVVNASALIGSPSTELCGPEPEMDLKKTGETASMTVTLSPIEYEYNSVCKLRVTAPKTHVISMQFVETSREIHRALMLNNSEEHHPSCLMSLYLPENPRVPIWKGDPCSGNPLPEIDLLTSDFKIIWFPPADPILAKGRKFILTAVGQGSVCKEPDQFACMKIGWDPLLCISDYLLCDGYTNCPPTSSSNDEDEKMCKTHFQGQASWKQLAVEIFNKLKPPSDLVNNNKWLQEKLEQHAASSKRPFLRDWHEVRKPETTTTRPVMEKKPKVTDSISQVLSKYGPWGYLMLGMLICGTVLMFCGLWECCIRKPKTQIEVPSPAQPTTVLIINHQEEMPPSPPNYDDLDQPPSYLTLFPNYNKHSSSCNIADVENSGPTNSNNGVAQRTSDNSPTVPDNALENVDET